MNKIRDDEEKKKCLLQLKNVTLWYKHRKSTAEQIDFAILSGDNSWIVASDLRCSIEFFQLLTGKKKQHEGIIRREVPWSCIPETTELIPGLSVFDHLCIAGYSSGLRGTQLRKRVNEMLSRSSLNGKGNLQPIHLPERLHFELIMQMALIKEPELLLVYDNTNKLEQCDQREYWELIKQTGKDEKVTLLVISTSDNKPSYFKRMYILSDGKLVET